MRKITIAIDGPAASGKSTVAKEVAKALNYIYIDSGAMYRALTLKALRLNIDVKDEASLVEMTKVSKITLDGVHIYLDDEDVSEAIRSIDVTNNVSAVSSYEGVREEMVNLQRKLAEGKNVIMEGRDICTYVFPNADVKIYLDASEDVRAKRRYDEMKEKGIEITYEEVLENIQKRDYNDKNKEMGALKLAEDSIVVDTTNLTIEEVVERIIEIIKDKKTKENI